MLTRPGDSLFRQIVETPSLYAAWRKVRANRGAAGVDAISLDQFEMNLAANLRELSLNLLSGSYQPMPARFVSITKANGKERELGILAVRDRVAQRAVLDAIEPFIEPHLFDCSFAFRQGRNVEMAIQRIIAARANGFWWTVESDVENFFGSIDRRLLLNEVRDVVPDENVLRLLQTWLDAGVLEMPREASITYLRQGRAAIANLKMRVRETISQSVDNYVAQRLGVGFNEDQPNDGFAYEPAQMPSDDDVDIRSAAQEQTRRAALKRLLQDGALLAIAQRSPLARLISRKVLGIGALAIAATALAPRVLEAYRRRSRSAVGTLQGAPISPLLTNFYMTPFDRELTGRGCRLIRYCDDFVIQCRTEGEAEAALRAAELTLAERRLRFNSDKTAIIPPGGEFEFLGYLFSSDGSVIPPPSVPEQIARQIKVFARRAASRLRIETAAGSISAIRNPKSADRI